MGRVKIIPSRDSVLEESTKQVNSSDLGSILALMCRFMILPSPGKYPKKQHGFALRALKLRKNGESYIFLVPSFFGLLL